MLEYHESYATSESKPMLGRCFTLFIPVPTNRVLLFKRMTALRDATEYGKNGFIEIKDSNFFPKAEYLCEFSFSIVACELFLLFRRPRFW
jgi:hypothetical protein